MKRSARAELARQTVISTPPGTSMHAKYAHTNLIARDWRTLVAFYERVFGCTPVPPERDLSGAWIEAATGVPGARIRGVHLRLPGHGDGGPTLEIFQYDPPGPADVPVVHRAGFGHLAFVVDDVAATRAEVLAAGGRDYGELVSVPVAGAGVVTFVYSHRPGGQYSRTTIVVALACLTAFRRPRAPPSALGFV